MQITMKKIIYLLLCLPFMGCSGFLDEVDQDKLVPEKTDHYAALLLNEFNNNYPIFKSIDHMTDNVVENSAALTTNKESYKTTYTWQREIEIDEDGDNVSTNTAWQYTYEDIAIANYVIELIDDALGDIEQINFIKGEAYFVRALSYFNLLNLYGQPYDESTATTALGVPLRDDIGVEVTYSRNTVQECYDFIESDLESALSYIVESGLEKSVWHPNESACYLLFSRAALYQEKWDEAITNATKVIEANRLGTLYASGTFLSEDNTEVLYSYNITNKTLPETTTSYLVSTELVNLYDNTDRRKSVYFTSIDNGTGTLSYQTNKFLAAFTSIGYTNMRVAEAYLNRAEAYAHNGDVANAIADIQTLHAARYSNTSAIEYPSDVDEVLAFILTERRKELCFEDHHRWFDLRRMANSPEIQHVFTLVNDDGTKIGTETYTLLSNDLNYTLPIPLKERENNSLIRNNERYEKIAEVSNETIIP